MRLFRLLSLLVALLLCVNAACRAQTATIVVVQSDASPAQQEFLDSLKGYLSRSEVPASLVFVTSQELDKVPPGTRLLLPVGARAAEAALALDNALPMLLALQPRNVFERLQARSARRLSAVFLDQPPERQLNLLRLALPDYHRVALLLGPESAGRSSGLASGRGLHLISENVANEGELFPALQKVLADADLLLAVPDGLVYNRQTLPNILLTTYHHKIPVVGFSPAYVRAGAALALYSTPSQMAEQCADSIKAFLAGRPLPSAQYPRDFSIGINSHVARALGLNLPDETILHNRLRQMEHQP